MAKRTQMMQLKARMTLSGLSSAELARRLGVSESQLSNALSVALEDLRDRAIEEVAKHGGKK